ncbi:MAG: TetR family transcriptional regulator [Chloroflexi bacterium]|nr:TetR family transcriptional regulator [Chloroflexota bacterium]
MFTITQTERHSTETRRREILAEARQIVATHGMHGLTVKTLARATGVTEGALYRHFEDKRAILLGLIDDMEETLFETLEKAEGQGGSALERLERLLEAHLSYSERRRGVSFVVISEVLLNGDRRLRQRMQTVIDRYLEMVQGVLEEGVVEGQVKQTIDLSAAALALFGLVQATITLWRMTSTELSPSERLEALWRIYRDGIAVS